MSHSIYKKKAFIELADGRILPLCLYADSSITGSHYDRKGRIHYFHPKAWCINTLNAGHGILVHKQEFNAAVAREYEKELEYLKEYRDKYEPQAGDPDGDSYSYFGTVYPGGGKMKHMKAFFSTKRTIPAEEFLQKNRFSIYIADYDPKDFKTIEEQTVPITAACDIIRADQIYKEICGRAQGRMCLGVHGLDGAD